jgi:hypothetical protein
MSVNDMVTLSPSNIPHQTKSVKEGNMLQHAKLADVAYQKSHLVGIGPNNGVTWACLIHQNF